MSKNLLQDVKIKYQRERTNSALDSVKTESKALSGGKGPQYKIWLVVIISIIFFVFAISYLFLRAVVTVNLKMQDLTLNENLSASLNGGEDSLPFNLIVISGEEEKVMEKTEEKDVAEKAKGLVIIYNAFSGGTQRLDLDTRLLGSNSKIYKTEKQVIVPGMKGNTPGSVEVGVYGIEAGEEYNSGPLDFTIVGFKGTPKYSKFYAISNIDDVATKGEIKGGFKGKTPFISDSQKTSIAGEMKTILQTKLFKKATDQIPNGFVLFKDAMFLDIDENNVDLTSLSSSENNMVIKLKGTLYGFLFNEEKLTKKLTEKNVKEGDNNAVYLSNIRDLNFSLSNKENISFADVKNINFTLSGSTKMVWKLDESKLLVDLLGKSKKDFYQILSQYPNIESAQLEISPFWKISLPDKSKDIKVIVNYPK